MLAGALALGSVLMALLPILLARGRATCGEEPEDARRFIAGQIDGHLEALAQRYLEARADQGACRPGTDRFVQGVELFIGEMLSRAERSEPELREALRETLVLQRDDIYGEIRKRVEAYLRRPPVSDQA